MELSFDALRKVQLQERNFSALSKLSDDFYEAHHLWLLEQKRALQGDYSLERLKAFENAKTILTEISEKREQKILLKALKDRKNQSVDSDGLAKEEKGLYLELLKSLSGFEQAVLINEEEQPKTVIERTITPETLPDAKPPEKPLLEAVRMLKPLAQFVGTDGAMYGPFKEGQIVSVQKEMAAIFVKKEIAEMATQASKKEIRDLVEEIASGESENQVPNVKKPGNEIEVY
ncbi:hypothetical protein KJ765_04275 [Candidatus Micrarchaeota archaeon]|nr:hypothetical protein [Candidatus Micrarchaeota archaeon]